MVVFRDYLLFYRHSQGQVIIERVLHGARDIRGLL
jgi:plasmid stabilization system protein ParE